MSGMTSLSRKLAAAGALAVALIASDAKADPQTDLVARGAYLAKAADCVGCHTVSGGTPFAGGRAFKLPFGVLYSSNITPDAGTGIAGYSDAAWIAMLHKGVARDGKHLYPAMPYTSYTLMSDDDALAIKAYLMSLKPIDAAPPANEIGFPFNQRWGLVFWNLFNNPDSRFSPDESKSAAYNRGAYLVNALGHCGECHTSRNFMMGLKTSKALSGEVQADWRAYNLTSDSTHGLGGWSDGAIAHYLSTGEAPGHGPASGPMAEAVEYSLSGLRQDDIAAIVTFLRGVPAQGDGPLPPLKTSVPLAPADPLGERLFAQACAGCHLPNGSGRQSPWAALAGSHSTSDPAATNLIQVLAKGSEIHTSQGLMFMHAFTGAYTDEELAALGNYVQGQFGGRTGTITPQQIAKQREAPSDKAGKPSS